MLARRPILVISRLPRAPRRLFDLNQASGLDRLYRYLAPDIGLDIGQRDRGVLTAKADRLAERTDARRAADTVNVVLCVLGEIVVEDVRYVGNM